MAHIYSNVVQYRKLKVRCERHVHCMNVQHGSMMATMRKKECVVWPKYKRVCVSEPTADRGEGGTMIGGEG